MFSAVNYEEHIARILLKDEHRMRCLHALDKLSLPQGAIGAGFLRNAIWDDLHQKSAFTPLNDVDVIYFCPTSSAQRDKALERRLHAQMPDVNWQVKNQARMHLQHGHPPYESCVHAVSYWIERETCVGVSLSKTGKFEFIAPYGFEANFANSISINPRYPRPDVFEARVAKKAWQALWPNLHVQPY